MEAAQNFVDINKKLAKKYKAKVSIGDGKGNDVTIADERDYVEAEDGKRLKGHEWNSHDDTVTAVSNLIKDNYPSLKMAHDRLTDAKKALQEALSEDKEYREADEALKLARDKKKARKAQLMNLPRYHDLTPPINDAKLELKDIQLSFNDWLLTFGDLTGKKEFDLGFGKPLKIRRTAKLG